MILLPDWIASNSMEITARNMRVFNKRKEDADKFIKIEEKRMGRRLTLFESAKAYVNFGC